jgi:hypothetical protein
VKLCLPLLALKLFEQRLQGIGTADNLRPSTVRKRKELELGDPLKELVV